MISNGIQGEYIARIFEEVKGRPLYVVGQTFGFDEVAQAQADPEVGEPAPPAPPAPPAGDVEPKSPAARRALPKPKPSKSSKPSIRRAQ
jgi:hypothetical protein